MTSETIHRHLAAILAADVAGGQSDDVTARTHIAGSAACGTSQPNRRLQLWSGAEGQADENRQHFRCISES